MTDTDLKQLKARLAEKHHAVHITMDSKTMFAMIDRIEKLEKVAKWAGHLKGDFISADEHPTHFNSWFVFVNALNGLEDN